MAKKPYIGHPNKKQAGPPLSYCVAYNKPTMLA